MSCDNCDPVHSALDFPSRHRKIGLFKNDYKGRRGENRQRYFSSFYSASIDEFKSGEVYSEVEIISNSNPTVAALFKFSVGNLTVHEALIYETEKCILRRYRDIAVRLKAERFS